ncbi:hypothetical protein MKX03_023903, partial [Papaver bracteatum]
MRIAAISIEGGKYPRLVGKLFKKLLPTDDPRGLRVDEMPYAINLIWLPVGRIIIKKTPDPQVFVFRFTTTGDFATAIYENPSRVHGNLLTFRFQSTDVQPHHLDFTVHDFR